MQHGNEEESLNSFSMAVVVDWAPGMAVAFLAACFLLTYSLGWTGTSLSLLPAPGLQLMWPASLTGSMRHACVLAAGWPGAKAGGSSWLSVSKFYSFIPPPWKSVMVEPHLDSFCSPFELERRAGWRLGLRQRHCLHSTTMQKRTPATP